MYLNTVRLLTSRALAICGAVRPRFLSCIALSGILFVVPFLATIYAPCFGNTNTCGLPFLAVLDRVAQPEADFDCRWTMRIGILQTWIDSASQLNLRHSRGPVNPAIMDRSTAVYRSTTNRCESPFDISGVERGLVKAPLTFSITERLSNRQLTLVIPIDGEVN